MRVIRPPKTHRVGTVLTVCVLVAIAAGVIVYHLNGGPRWLLWIPLLLMGDAINIVWERWRGRQARQRRWPGLLLMLALLPVLTLLLWFAFSLGYGAFHVAAALGLVAAGVAALEFTRTYRRPTNDGTALRPCPHCGYERRDLGARAVCPECGRSPWL